MERKVLDSNEMLGVAVDLLGHLHLFFSRVEAKSSFLLGVNTGMIWFLATRLPPIKMWDAYLLVAILPIALITASLAELYKSSFPQLKGGRDSLTSYKEIAKRSQESFLADFTKQTQEELALDLLGQVWQNSEILTSKIDSLKRAYALCAFAFLPWGLAIIVSVTR
jgi:hypothetical protein